MEPIEFTNRENPDHEAQLAYLIKREFFVSYYNYRKFPYYLIGSTLITLGIILFTPSDSLITFKVLLIALLSITWLVTILFTLSILYKWLKRSKWKSDSVVSAKNSNLCYKLYFDQEKITIETSTYKSELFWDYYTYWAENKNSIFIFQESDLYGALYYSEADLGIENYSELKSIASAKLIKLDK